MNEKKNTNQTPAELTVNTYQTGSTVPPKNPAGILTVLLSVIIFICGISTIFSLTQINSMQKGMRQAEKQTCRMAFEKPAQPNPHLCALQFEGEPLDDFWRSYHNLPQGIYVTDPGGCKNLQTGDVIVSVGKNPVNTWSELEYQLEHYGPGQQVPLTVYRDGNRLLLMFTLQS